MSWNAPTRVIFPAWVDPVVKGVVALALAGGGYVTLLVAFGASPKTTDVGYAPVQPVPYSHAMHVGQLGLDCRYCHTGVETGAKANIPPTQTCMNCHSKVLTESPLLAPVRDSARTGRSVEWIRVHDLPDYVYFNHSAHVMRGVGCEECHGRVDTMDVVRQEKSLSMAFCVDCHRHPEARVRPAKDVTVMGWAPEGGQDRATFGREFVRHNTISPATDCSTCHR